MKEVSNHIKHLEITFGRLLDILFSKEELDALDSMKSEAPEILSKRSAWIRTSDLAIEGVTTIEMALIHLLWFQRNGRIVIEDIDPFSGAILLHLSFKDIEEDWERMKRS